MRLSSALPSFALIALSFFQLEASVAHSHAGHLQHHDIDNGHSAASSGASPIAPSRRRKKCASVPAGTASAASASGTGSPWTNGTTLANSLQYSRSSTAGGLPVQTSGSNASPLTRTSAGTCQSETTTVTDTIQVTVTVTTNSGNGPASSEIGTIGVLTSTPLAGPSSSSVYSNVTSTAATPQQPSGGVASISVTAPVIAELSSSAASSDTSTSVNSLEAASPSAIPPAAPSSSTVSAAPTGLPQASNNSSSTGPSSNTADSSISPAAGEFWAGATIGWIPREEAIPGRVFYDYDGKTVKDSIKTFGEAGMNAFRLETSRDQCLGPTNFVNNASTLGDELVYGLDIGCIDIAVKTAQRARAAGMKRFQLTINQGFTIPKALESLSYGQMIGNIRTETKRQLQPFLDANVLPDIILFENEGTDGFLFIEESTGHHRGSKDGKASAEKTNQELCGQIPTGKMDSYPQYAGYLKAEINACNEAITAAGFQADSVRYGLHSHGQYVQWKEGFVHGPDQHSQSALLDSSSGACSGTNPIPKDVLAQNVTTMMTIMGFSAYPKNMESPAPEQSDGFSNIVDSLTKMQGYADAWGKHTDGPFKGQNKLQALGCEYATTYKYEDNAKEVAFTEAMFKAVKKFDVFLGMLWWEATYCYNDWEGGDATMYRRVTDDSKITGVAPLNTVKTFGEAAVSSWN